MRARRRRRMLRRRGPEPPAQRAGGGAARVHDVIHLAHCPHSDTRPSGGTAMPIATIRGVNINYRVLGDRGPWVALSPGGRRDQGVVEPLAELSAEAGFRVLLHDRRNCGASDVIIAGEESEYEIWADDLYELLSQLGARPAFVGATSSG